VAHVRRFYPRSLRGSIRREVSRMPAPALIVAFAS
jgi:hypothetical protein